MDVSVSDTSRAPEGAAEKSTAFEPNPDCSAHVNLTPQPTMIGPFQSSFSGCCPRSCLASVLSQLDPVFGLCFLTDDVTMVRLILAWSKGRLTTAFGNHCTRPSTLALQFSHQQFDLHHTALSHAPPPLSHLKQTSGVANDPCGLLCASSSGLGSS